jgi:UDP-glucuronate decarboxylase
VNVGNPGEFTMLEFADLVLELTRSSSVIEHRPLPSDDPKVRQPDITIARDTLGWQPTIPLRDGLARTVSWFRDRSLVTGVH